MASLRLKTFVVIQLSVWFAYAYGVSSFYSRRFDCGNGKTVPLVFVCDGYNDCGDGAEESNCSGYDFDCGDAKIVRTSALCDGDDDCGNGADERNCDRANPVASTTANPVASTTANPVTSTTANPVTSTTANPGASTTANPVASTTANAVPSTTANPVASTTANPVARTTVNPDLFNCGNGNTVPVQFRCDGDDDCRNGADERNCSRVRFDCGNGRSVPNAFLCDGDDDCRNGADERNCSHVRFDCGNGNAVPQHYLCDGDNDCRNGADERHCIRGQFNCGNGNTVPQRYLCDGDDNCRNGADERNCSSERFDCGNGIYVQQLHLCDGDDDCRNGADERNCSRVFSGRFNCGNGNVVSQNRQCDGIDNCGNGADERNCSPGIRETWMGIGDGSSGVVALFLTEDTAIQCHNFPWIHRRNSNAFWNVRTIPGHRIKVNFVLKELEDGRDCRADRLTLYDGKDHFSPSLGVYHGQDEDELPEPTVTSSNAMLMQFTRDSRINRKAYHLVLSAICGENLIAQPTWNAFISHPMFGVQTYRENISCDWIIKSTPEKNVKIIFTAFEVGTTTQSTDAEELRQEAQVSGCENSTTGNCVQYNTPGENNGRDFVEIYNGPDDSSMRIGKYAGYQIPPPEITARSDALLIRFRSGDQGNFRGFRVLYQEV